MTDVPESSALAAPLRVRWSEVDAQGVVFNGHYLNYADVAQTEYWRAAKIGLDLFGAEPMVVKATLEYRASARFDDLLTLRGSIVRLGTTSFTFEMQVCRDNEVLCRVEVIYVNIDLQTRRPAPWPEELRQAIGRFEGNRPAVHSNAR